MADAVGLWVIVYFCVTSVNTKDTVFKSNCRLLQSVTSPTPEYSLVSTVNLTSLEERVQNGSLWDAT